MPLWDAPLPTRLSGSSRHRPNRSADARRSGEQVVKQKRPAGLLVAVVGRIQDILVHDAHPSTRQ